MGQCIVTRGMEKMNPGFLLITLTVFASFEITAALENGLARTPPMGWLAWQRFRCNIDCDNDPNNCVREELFMEMADLIVSEGYLDAGYDFISLDDCWSSLQRNANGQLQSDPIRFPSGIKALADYVHNKGLRFGMYADYGTLTCGGYPGVLNHQEMDAKTFAEWGVDQVKLDGCYVEATSMDKGYPEFGRLLNATGRPMVYSCSWPAYQENPDYEAIAEACNLWRNYDDIDDSWESVTSIVDWYAANQDMLIKYAGPGHFNDPDMLIIGNFGLSYEQSRTQMALWAILAAPLIMSNDLRSIKPEMKAILLNKNVIAINQDPLGMQGRLLSHDNGLEVWLKPVLPEVNEQLSASIAFVNRRTDGLPRNISVVLEQVGLHLASGYHVQELFDGKDLGIYYPHEMLSVKVNVTGVYMVKLTAQTQASD